MSIYFSEGDGIAMFVGRGGKALHTVEVAGTGNVPTAANFNLREYRTIDI